MLGLVTLLLLFIRILNDSLKAKGERRIELSDGQKMVLSTVSGRLPKK